MDKSFIHCPAEDKAEATIFGFKPQDEYKPGLAERDNCSHGIRNETCHFQLIRTGDLIFPPAISIGNLDKMASVYPKHAAIPARFYAT